MNTTISRTPAPVPAATLDTWIAHDWSHGVLVPIKDNVDRRQPDTAVPALLDVPSQGHKEGRLPIDGPAPVPGRHGLHPTPAPVAPSFPAFAGTRRSSFEAQA